MNIIFGVLVIAICILGLGYLLGFAVVNRDDYHHQLVKYKTLHLERLAVGMTYIGYVSLVIVFIIGLVFGVELLGAK